MIRFGICGFYGQGNLGDEAMLAGLLHWLKDKPAIPVIFPDYNVVHAEVARRYEAYSDIHVTHMGNRTLVSDCRILLIGGGDLGVGFGWNLIPVCLHSGNRLVSVSMTFGHQWAGKGFHKAHDLNCQVLRSFDYIAARDNASRERLGKLGIHSRLGFDLASLLPRSAALRQANRVTVFVRGGEYVDHYPRLAEKVIAWLQKQQAEIFIGACAPIDETLFPVFQRKFPGTHFRKTNFDWRRGLDLVKSSSLVISIGRLHPVILATHEGTPSIGVGQMSHHPPERIGGFCMDSNIPFVSFDGEKLLETIEKCWEARAGLVPKVKERGEHMEHSIRRVMERVWEIASAD